MKIKLPTYHKAALSILKEETTSEHKATSLERFIYEEQPNVVHEGEFRNNLEKLIIYFEERQLVAVTMAYTNVLLGLILGILILGILRYITN